jgi:hypothetical protein
VIADAYGKQVVLKISLYDGKYKRQVQRIKELAQRYNNVIVSIDLIIPQKGASCPGALIHDKEKLLKEVSELKGIFGRRLWLLSTTVQRLYLDKVYYCPVPFGGVYVMPDGRIVPCSRYSHLDTGFTADNFDLKEYVKKYDGLVSNYCLFENKYFDRYWDSKENPANWGEADGS